MHESAFELNDLHDVLRVLSGSEAQIRLSANQMMVGAVLETRRHEFVLAWAGNDMRTRITIEREAAAAGVRIDRRMRARPDLLRVLYDHAGRSALRTPAEPDEGKAEPRRLVDRIISDAIGLGASDIHLQVEETHLNVAFRVHGDLIPWSGRLPRSQGEQIGITLWNMKDASSAADEFRKSTYQQCRIVGDFRVGAPGSEVTVQAQLRYQSAPMKGDSFKIVLRLEARRAAPDRFDLARCGYSPAQRAMLELAAMASDGLVLVSGPVNSGKTVTLGALGAFQVSVHGQRKIIATVEDPIELRIDGACQHPVLGTDGHGFDEAVQSALRQDVNTLILGEIRTASTAAICRKAAETGHLILSSVHATDAWSTLTRIVALGIETEKLGEPGFLRLVCNQRLLPELCPACSMSLDQVSASSPLALQVARIRRLVSGFADVDRIRCKSVSGCPSCRGGAVGLRLVSEILAPDDSFCTRIQAGDLKGARDYWISGELAARAGLPSASAYGSAVDLMANGLVCPFDIEHRFGPLRTPSRHDRHEATA